MKELLTNANFPRTADLRVYHLGVRPGEVANRILTVGSSSRAEKLAAFLDDKPKPFILSSERGFVTITGRCRGVPISIVSIGMGFPNMDFFVREMRETISGDMIVIRLGSCGAVADLPVSSVVVPEACVQISRNVDFDFANPGNNTEPAYRISKPVSADVELVEQLIGALEAAKPPFSSSRIFIGKNASADSFYSSQGRQTSFSDHNADLIERLQSSVPNILTLEMETFHLYHLAACWRGRSIAMNMGVVNPIHAVVAQPKDITPQVRGTVGDTVGSLIRVAAVHMVFASRTSLEFITPQSVDELETWTGKAILNAVVDIAIPEDKLHGETGSVWKIV